MKEFFDLPKVGIGYRQEIHDQIFEHANDLECLEFISEMFFSPYKVALLHELADHFALIPHGLDLSIASMGINKPYLKQVRRLVDMIDSPYYSDHLALTNCPGIALNNLTPVFLFKSQLQVVVDKVKFIQDYIQRPLVLENITQLICFKGEMTAYEFAHELVERTSCGLLLDVTNTYVDSFNYDFDPERELEKWPLESVYHIHLSGGRTVGEEKMDGHDAPIEEKSWTLFEKNLPRMSRLQTIIIERDANFLHFSQLIDEVNRAKQLVRKEMAWIS